MVKFLRLFSHEAEHYFQHMTWRILSTVACLNNLVRLLIALEELPFELPVG